MAQGTCSIEGCNKPVFNKMRGWCSMHYARWQRHGDPSIVFPNKQLVCSVEGCDRGGPFSRGFCKLHYYHWKQHGDPSAGQRNRHRRTILAILEAGAYAETNECIIMEDRSNTHPHTTLNGRVTLASRAVWTIANGDPGDSLVLHRCNGGSGANGCINIRHLYLGTHLDNVRDKVKAGRHRGWKLTKRPPRL